MRAPVSAICRPEVAHGLALTGLRPQTARDGEAAERVLHQLADLPAGGGVILIERCLYDELPRAAHARLRREGVPVLLPFPSPARGEAGARAPEEDVLEVLRQAVGYRVRLR